MGARTRTVVRFTSCEVHTTCSVRQLDYQDEVQYVFLLATQSGGHSRIVVYRVLLQLVLPGRGAVIVQAAAGLPGCRWT
jgi:hypothetical protein